MKTSNPAVINAVSENWELGASINRRVEDPSVKWFYEELYRAAKNGDIEQKKIGKRNFYRKQRVNTEKGVL